MNWQDEGYLISKIKFRENAVIIKVFTKNNGKVSGIVYGGNSRKKSVESALRYVNELKEKPENILIHDAARPNISLSLIRNIKKHINKKNVNFVVPYTNIDSTLKKKKSNQIKTVSRKNYISTQTPQAFKYKYLYNLATSQSKIINDEATLFIENNKKIKFIKGENKNNKITFLEDIKKTKNYFGIGFDIHKLIRGKSLYLGGIKIPYHSGLQGHSDGDVIIHAVIDALLGALRQKDIGTYFPSNKNKFKNIRSPKMLKPIINKLNNQNYSINNIDINLICQKPKVSRYRHKIIKSLSTLLNLDIKFINLKGKTVEKLGLIGKEKAIACEVIISINKYE